MRARVMFSVYFDYYVEGETKADCLDKAEDMFHSECPYSCDEWDVDIIEEDDE